jgi:thioredoxin-related protein
MYKFYFLIILSLIFCFQTKTARPEVALVNGTYNDTLLLAEQEDKKVFILFTSESCHWCESQKQVFLDSEILDVLENHIIHYVDITKNKDLAKKYKVRAVPSSFVIDSKENIYKKNTGYLNKEKFINWIK